MGRRERARSCWRRKWRSGWRREGRQQGWRWRSCVSRHGTHEVRERVQAEKERKSGNAQHAKDACAKGACVQAALMRTVTSVALYLIEFAANLIAKDPIFVAMVSVHLRLSCSSHRSPLAAHRKDHLWPFSLELQKPNATVGLFRVDLSLLASISRRSIGDVQAF